MKKLIPLICIFAFLAGCQFSKNSTQVSDPSNGGAASVIINMGGVGYLAKTDLADIQLEYLVLTLSAPGEITSIDTMPVSGNGQIMVNKVYSGLNPLVTWTLDAVSKDINDSTIHSGSTSFMVPPGGNTNVSLVMDAQYSMLKAEFSPIRDSVNKVELVVNTVIVDEGSFPKQSNVGGTETLSFDYLTAPGTHDIELNVYGEMWGLEYLLYTGDTTVNTVPGQDATYEITLSWVGPNEPPPGQATMTVTLGAVGTTTVKGTLDDHDGSQNSGPKVIFLPPASIPSIPSGLKVTCYDGPDSPSGNSPSDCAVIEWDGYFYWGLSYTDNRVAMSVVKFDSNGNLIGQLEKSGARYIWGIDLDFDNETATFKGQATGKFTVTWTQLQAISAPPVVVTLPPASAPSIPAGLKVTCYDGSGSPSGASPSDCPVVQWKSFSYWAFSYVDNRVSLNITKFDADGNIVSQVEKSGARYIWGIDVDTNNETLTFKGQATGQVTMSWSEL